MLEINAILTIALRDFTKLLRDRFRLAISFIFPIIFIGALGTSLQSNIGEFIAFNYLTFTFTGVFAQTLFQSTASGIISLIQAVGVILFGLFMSLFFDIDITLFQLLISIPAIFAACLLGGAFGTLVMAAFGNQRSANQLFPFVIFPQFFLAGVFNPIKELPLPLMIASRLAPMTYAVDFFRGLYYWGHPDYDSVVLYHPAMNLVIISVMFLVMISIGTYLFVKNERNR